MSAFIQENPQMKKTRRPNGYIKFRAETWKEHKRAYPNARSHEYSGIAATRWRELSDAEKNKYIMISEVEKRKVCNSKNDLQKKKVKRTYKKKKGIQKKSKSKRIVKDENVSKIDDFEKDQITFQAQKLDGINADNTHSNQQQQHMILPVVPITVTENSYSQIGIYNANETFYPSIGYHMSDYDNYQYSSNIPVVTTTATYHDVLSCPESQNFNNISTNVFNPNEGNILMNTVADCNNLVYGDQTMSPESYGNYLFLTGNSGTFENFIPYSY
ncbi:16043_t:CDS:1 [Funneliformis caledonium]|uniref:16043_t:CDS:1 n=1 Tax=Funneliformis caledonium TaxID=1117310 RepID=A0A9N8VXZ6_9GLOM|nr:16043_t:CDS:1 [Funneliformis caledonium]